jgi:hypothetical protein
MADDDRDVKADIACHLPRQNAESIVMQQHRKKVHEERSQKKAVQDFGGSKFNQHVFEYVKEGEERKTLILVPQLPAMIKRALNNDGGVKSSGIPNGTGISRQNLVTG